MSPELLPTRNPRTGEIDYQMPLCPPAEVAATAQDLRKAQGAWREMGVAARVQVLQRWAKALREHRPAMLAALVLDTGRHAEAVRIQDRNARTLVAVDEFAVDEELVLNHWHFRGGERGARDEGKEDQSV